MGARGTRAGIAVVVTAMAWLAGPASAQTGDRDSRYRERTCERAMDESPTGELEKTVEPSGGSVVSPGQTVRVVMRWDTADRPGGDLHKVIDCVVVDGVLDAGLSVEERPTGNDGVFEAQLVIPELPPGTEICDFGFLSDDEEGHGYVRSETLCLTVGDQQAAAVPQPTDIPAGTDEAPAVETASPAPAPAPAPASTPAPVVMGDVLAVPELPRTGPAEDRRTIAGAALALGGLGLLAATRRRP